MASSFDTATLVTEWVAALEERHLADLRVPEVTKALRALSSAYVERRSGSVHRTLDAPTPRSRFPSFSPPTSSSRRR
jgi:hypothetical protein